MAVDGITGSTPVALPVSATPQDSARLVNETLRDLAFPAGTAAASLPATGPAPLLAVLTLTRELDFLQQNLLLLNATLRNLAASSPVRPGILAGETTPPTVEAAGLLEGLEAAGQNVLRINEILGELGPGGAEPAAPASRPLPAAAAAAATVPPQEEVTPSVAPGSPAAVEPGAVAQPAAVTIATTGVAANFLIPEATPATLPVSLFPDRAPYVLVVYQINDPALQAREPGTFVRQVPPAAPVAATRPPGDARLRQLLLRGREEGRGGKVDYSAAPVTVEQAERSIRHTLTLVNADMAAHGLPLHLVFARGENGFALNVYDCSYDEACRLSYNVPLSLDRLTGLLGRLQHETGIIVDRES